jgi:hypothetical protein
VEEREERWLARLGTGAGKYIERGMNELRLDT